MINKYKKIVIKIGSSSIVNPKSKKINVKWMKKLCEDIKKYHKEKNIIIVCSGAIALGSPLIKNKNLRKLEDKQAAASVGQIELAHQWKQHLKTHKIDIAQILITLEDSEVRRRYLNARKTINTLLDNKIIPVINENDTVATEEIRYGDNDKLAARVGVNPIPYEKDTEMTPEQALRETMGELANPTSQHKQEGSHSQSVPKQQSPLVPFLAPKAPASSCPS